MAKTTYTTKLGDVPERQSAARRLPLIKKANKASEGVPFALRPEW